MILPLATLFENGERSAPATPQSPMAKRNGSGSHTAYKSPPI